MLAYLSLIQKDKSSFNMVHHRKQRRRSTSAGANARFRKSITGARRTTTVLQVVQGTMKCNIQITRCMLEIIPVVELRTRNHQAETKPNNNSKN
jgi:hypothetical protein